jgi:hypothetical protein
LEVWNGVISFGSQINGKREIYIQLVSIIISSQGIAVTILENQIKVPKGLGKKHPCLQSAKKCRGEKELSSKLILPNHWGKRKKIKELS